MEDGFSFADQFVCTELRLPQDIEQSALRDTLTENPRNSILTTGGLPGGESGTDFYGASLVVDAGDPGLPSSLALNVGKKWANGRTLNIRFLSGDETVKASVKKYAGIWTQYANIKFNWVTEEPSDIRIAFIPGGGSYSYCGIDCSKIPPNELTMNFGWLNSKSTQDQIRTVVLHEFGHALGCVHEHQSPLSQLEWNEDVIYQEMSKPPNSWSRQKIKFNVLDRLTAADNVLASAFDFDSIMLYEYPARWIKNNNGKGTKQNTRLSTRDKEYIAYCYPPYSSDIGTFSTLQVRPWDTYSDAPDAMSMPFEPPYLSPPRLAIGLTWLDLDFASNITVAAAAESIQNDNFRVSIRSGTSTRLFTAACSWLEIAAQEEDVLVTQFSTADVLVPSVAKPGQKVVQHIRFAQRFDGNDPPAVAVWLTALDLDKDSPWRLRTYATDITPFGFSLHVDALDATLLYSATVTCIAFPADKEGWHSGSFDTSSTRSRDVPQHENLGRVEFPEGKFQTPPQVMMAISGLDYENGHNLRLRLSSSAVGKEGLTWHLDSWMDSVMKGAEGAFVAVAPPGGAA